MHGRSLAVIIGTQVVAIKKEYVGYDARRRAVREWMSQRYRAAMGNGGCYRAAAIFPKRKFVLKFDYNRRSDEALAKEAARIREWKSDPSIEKYFPKVHLFEIPMGNDILRVQMAEYVPLVGGETAKDATPELVRQIHDYNTNNRRNEHKYPAAYNIACKLGIADMHDGNYGWRVSRGKIRHPVLVDVDLGFGD